MSVYSIFASRLAFVLAALACFGLKLMIFMDVKASNWFPAFELMPAIDLECLINFTNAVVNIPYVFVMIIDGLNEFLWISKWFP